jgi:hypothetical protein
MEASARESDASAAGWQGGHHGWQRGRPPPGPPGGSERGFDHHAADTVVFTHIERVAPAS